MTRLQLACTAMTVAFAISLTACTPAKAPDAAVDTGKISDAIKADVAAGLADFNAHDVSKAGSHDAPDAVEMFHGMPNVVGIDAIKADAAKNPDTSAHVDLSNESVDVAASGDMAVYHSTFAVTFTDPKTKKPGSSQGNYLVGYKKQADGSWKIEWSVVSDTPAPEAKPADAKPADTKPAAPAAKN